MGFMGFWGPDFPFVYPLSRCEVRKQTGDKTVEGCMSLEEICFNRSSRQENTRNRQTPAMGRPPLKLRKPIRDRARNEEKRQFFIPGFSMPGFSEEHRIQKEKAHKRIAHRAIFPPKPRKKWIDPKKTQKRVKNGSLDQFAP
eukprot:529242-Amphidinium_carterae.1